MTAPTLPPPTTSAASSTGASAAADRASRAWPVGTAGTPSRSASSYVCPACFGPLEVTYDMAVVAATFTREAIAAASTRGSGATSSCCRSRHPGPVAAGRLDAAHRRRTAWPRRWASTQLWLKDDTRNPSLSFKDRAGRHRRGPRGRVRRAGARLRLDRQPGRRHGSGGCRGRAPGLRLHPGRPRARQGRPRARLRRDGRPDRRARTTTSTASASRSPTRPAGASSTSTCARSTRRGPRPSPTRSPSRSVGARRTSSSAPVASGAMFTRVARGFEELAELGLIERRPIRFVGGQAARLRAGRDRLRTAARTSSSPSASRTPSSARWPSAIRPTVATRSSSRATAAARSRPSRTRRPPRRSATSPGSRASTRRRPAA